MPDLLTTRAPVHFIGIGGAGMSAIARVLLARGIPVSGSDMKDVPVLAALRAMGARVAVGYDRENIESPASVVVSSAIRPDNPELLAARADGIPVMHRAQMLALLMRERRGIAIAGTHGKTTTTSMVALLFQRAGLSPTFLIGGDLNESGTNASEGSGEWVIAEADESDGSFLWLGPEIGVITNIEAEHLDHYADEHEIRETFLAFMANIPEHGAIVACSDDRGVRAVLPRAPGRVVTYGLAEAAWTAERRVVAGGQELAVHHEGRKVGDLRLSVPGEHNARNALAALATADLAGIAFDEAARALATYEGVRRRFQSRGTVGGVTVVDDYAHNPTKVRAALQAARETGPARVIAVFQPHLYSRTLHLGAEIGEALTAADLVVVTDVYGAREDPTPGVTGKIVVDGVLAVSPRHAVAYLPDRGVIADYVARRARSGDLVLTIGAGDITMFADEILRSLGKRTS